jgi:hypothetical protein
VEALLRDAVAEQSSGVSALRATGAQPERPDGREHVPLPLCPEIIVRPEPPAPPRKRRIAFITAG